MTNMMLILIVSHNLLRTVVGILNLILSRDIRDTEARLFKIPSNPRQGTWGAVLRQRYW